MSAPVGRAHPQGRPSPCSCSSSSSAGLGGLIGSRLPARLHPEGGPGLPVPQRPAPARGLARSAPPPSATRSTPSSRDTPGVKYYTGVVGFSLLSSVNTTYSAFYFLTLDPWDERDPKGLTAESSCRRSEPAARGLARGAVRSRFPPPAIPGVGTSGGVTFVLEDRAGKDVQLPRREDARSSSRRRASGRSSPASSPRCSRACPRSSPTSTATRCCRQGVNLTDVYQTLQAFLGGYFVNYFNRFGRVWQVYVQAEGEYRTRAENIGQFYVRNATGQPGAAVDARHHEGRQRARVHHALQRVPVRADQRDPRPRLSAPQQGMKALEEVFAQTHAAGDGLRLHGHVLPGEGRRPGRSGQRHLRLLAARGLPDPGRAVRELVPALRRAPRHAHRRLRRAWRAAGSAASRWTCSRRSASSCSSAWPPRTPSSSSSSARTSTSAASRSTTPRWPARGCACAPS